MSNEQAVIRIQQGEKELIPELWEMVYKLLYKLIMVYFSQRKEQAEKYGYTLEDMKQEAFFVMLWAVHYYDPKKPYKFSSYIKYAIKKQIDEKIGLRTICRKRDILSNSVSLDAEIDEEGLTLLDCVADKSDSYRDFERAYDNAILHADLENAISKLEPLQQGVINGLYFEGKKAEQVSAETGIPIGIIKSQKTRGLINLGRDKRLRQYRENIIDRHAYNGGFGSWYYNRGSSTELTALKLIDLSERINTGIYKDRV